MNIYINPSPAEQEALCKRPSSDNPVVRARVESILERVRTGGDNALKELALEIDGRAPESLLLSREEIAEACARVSPKVKEAIADAASNIRAFHTAQMPSTVEVWTTPAVRCIQKPVPIGKVGLYIPGGTAPLFSTVLMLAVPASIAGCKEVVLCTPAGKDGKVSPEVIYAASFCGVDKIFTIGGAQAVAAMAYGTESVPKVDKIFGPGNQYVTTAKQMLAGKEVAIDMPAGPSEVMVIADDAADPAFVAADLLSQAEHGRDSQVMLVCRSREFAEKVIAEVGVQTESLGRKEFAEAALGQSAAVVFDDEDAMVAFADIYAPEHLIINTEKPWTIADRVQAAGSVFVGAYTPESAGDYASGTNHTLPTCGWARSFSGVNMDSFMRKMTIQVISREGLEALGGTIITMAEAEGLQAHANAVKIRLEGDGK
ncbi:MAG: histidinol dehydrogenase [Bacteroidales bacterium]|nr:histidinol dehydrogenase [Bacteroidales bacterium]